MTELHKLREYKQKIFDTSELLTEPEYEDLLTKYRYSDLTSRHPEYDWDKLPRDEFCLKFKKCVEYEEDIRLYSHSPLVS